jgi:hypothetical protein
MWAFQNLTAYGVILVIWGALFELVGFGLMFLVYRAIQHEEKTAKELNDAPQPPATEAAKPLPSPTPAREREVAVTRR